MNIALIGYKGFVGSAIFKKIKAVGIDRNNYERMKENEYDIIINCAMPSKRFWALNNPLDDFKATVGLTADIFYNWRYKKLIQISSVSARCQLDHPYGVNKSAAESIVLSNKNNLVLRLGALFGEGLDKGVIFDMLNGNEIFVLGESRYNYISTEKVADIVLSKLNESGVVDVGARDSISLKEVADYFKINVKFGERFEEQVTENPSDNYPEAKEVLKFMEKKI